MNQFLQVAEITKRQDGKFPGEVRFTNGTTASFWEGTDKKGNVVDPVAIGQTGNATFGEGKEYQGRKPTILRTWSTQTQQGIQPTQPAINAQAPLQSPGNGYPQDDRNRSIELQCCGKAGADMAARLLADIPNTTAEDAARYAVKVADGIFNWIQHRKEQ